MCFRNGWLYGAAAVALAAVPAAAQEGPYFERVGTYPVFHNLPEGADPATETVAEIVSASEDGMMLAYTDSPGERIGLVDISNLSAPQGAGTVELGGEPTSVTIVEGKALVGVNTSASFTEPSGHVAVIDIASGEVTATCDVGGQPDSVAASPDHAYLAIAIENERDEDLNDGIIPQMPAGHLAVFDLAGGDVANCDAVRIIDLTGLAEIAGDDPEPEFVDINAANVAVVTMQENNHIALVDLASGAVTGHFSAGSVDLEAIDTVEDDVITANGSLTGLAREPDAVAWLDESRFFTANEGDYEGGSRGVSVFDTEGNVLWDSGSQLEHWAISAGHFPDGRAENKGVEPEGADTGVFGDTIYAFALSERGNFVAIYEDSGDAGMSFVQALPTAVGPEGVVAIPSRDLFVVSTEVDAEDDGLRGTLSFYTRTAESIPYPTIVSADDPETGAPFGWGALSALVADPEDANRLYGVSDSIYSVSSVYEIDVSQSPAVLTRKIDVVKDGEPAAYDLEGIALTPDGGFWLASEGNAEKENPLQQKSMILKVSAEGTVEEEITLPDAAYDSAISRGFEGVATWGDRLIVAVQSPWKDDPESTTKLGIFDPAEQSWSFVRYPLSAPESERGGWVGLSEITPLGDDRFAIIERDNQPGEYAAIKTVTTIDLAGIEPAALEGDIPLVEKTQVIDLLPVMLATNGWIGDKAEGLAVTADGRVFMATDNDGMDDATGETLFVELGKAEDLF